MEACRRPHGERPCRLREQASKRAAPRADEGPAKGDAKEMRPAAQDGNLNTPRDFIGEL